MIRKMPACALATVCALAWPAAGQYYVQQGNVLDANNRVGSGGLNYGNRPFYPNATNRLITNNVTGLAGFRGYSPIRNPNSFYLGSPVSGGLGVLPSEALSGFRSESVGVGELRQFPRLATLAPLPYYSRSGTVANTGQIVRGLNRPGTSELRSDYLHLPTNFRSEPINPLETARSNLIGEPLRVETRLIRADTGRPIQGPVNQRLLSSPLFGAVRAVPLEKLAQATEGLVVPPTVSRRPGRQPAGPIEAEEEQPPPGETVLRGERGLLNRPIGEIGVPVPEGEQAPGSLARPLLPPAEAVPGAQPQPPGGLRQVLPETNLGTFMGAPQERLKAQLAEAGQLLQEGRYYDAAQSYELAHAMDLSNPLPLFGQAMSLLAAGDYLASANDLFMAIRLAGPTGTLKLDLKQFVPDLETLDRRRAFLEQRLEVYDDFRLRFLLGWAEYMSGLAKVGLPNMQKAAKAAPEGMEAVQRFVDALTARQSTQPAGTQPG